ncbi:hypothetical protein R1Y80_00795 [Streptomyces sp. JL1001]|uniref:Uncharacterized protein n=1 Tax=Streptomyces sp. JL1001 TaxID=3078227 RepID=A0AAU8K8I5_9ACTN
MSTSAGRALGELLAMAELLTPREPFRGIAHLTGQEGHHQTHTPMSDVPPALRGPNWTPRPW